MSDTIDLNTEPTLSVDDEGWIYLNSSIVACTEEDITGSEVYQLQDTFEAANLAFQEIEIFCKRVEAGQIYSRTTYNKFLDILYLANKRTKEEDPDLDLIKAYNDNTL